MFPDRQLTDYSGFARHLAPDQMHAFLFVEPLVDRILAYLAELPGEPVYMPFKPAFTPACRGLADSFPCAILLESALSGSVLAKNAIHNGN